MVNKYSRICIPLIFIISFIYAEKVQFDGEGCDKLNLVLANEDCPSTGLFSAPGDCTVFFKCMKGVSLPFLEHCGMGYIFNGTECQINSNKTECPQFHCVPSGRLGSASFLTSNEKTTNVENKIQQPTYRPINIPYGNVTSTSTTESENDTPTIEEKPEIPGGTDFEMQTTHNQYKSAAIGLNNLNILILHCFTFVIICFIRSL